MTDVQTLSIIIAAVGVSIAAINSIISSRKAEKNNQQILETRQAQLFMQMYDRWSSPELRIGTHRLTALWSWNDSQDFEKKYGDKVNLEQYVKSLVVPASFIEGIGVLVERGLIDVTLVDQLMHNTIKNFWETIQPLIIEDRKQQKADMHPHFDSIEDLYNRIQKLT
jgi:hypothetical protein